MGYHRRTGTELSSGGAIKYNTWKWEKSRPYQYPAKWSTPKKLRTSHSQGRKNKTKKLFTQNKGHMFR